MAFGWAAFGKTKAPMHAAEESKHKNYICSCTQGALTLGEVEVLDSRLRWEGDMKSGLEPHKEAEEGGC